MLEKKARASLSKYRTAAVIGNLLSSYKDKVTFFVATGETVHVERAEEEPDIEVALVRTVQHVHNCCAAATAGSSG